MNDFLDTLAFSLFLAAGMVVGTLVFIAAIPVILARHNFASKAHQLPLDNTQRLNGEISGH